MKFILLMLLAWLALPVAAQDCETKSLGNPNAPGSYAVLHATPQGAAARWWCPGATPGTWKATGYAGLWADQLSFVVTVVPRVLGDPAPWTRWKTETAAAPKPVAGTLAACRVAELHQLACMKLMAAALPGYPVLTAAEALAPGRCGAAPDCAAVVPLPAMWRTPAGGSSVYPVVGTRVGPPIAGRRAAGNAACDLARFKYTAGTYTYGALASGPDTEAVLCVQAPL